MPDQDDIFFIPQVAYLPHGNLRDQIIYPDSREDMERKGWTDEKLTGLMHMVNLAYLVTREGGYDAQKFWHEIFSGGERQRIAIARCYYHRPKYAILDECTSAVSSDVEWQIYTQAKEMNITLITVSHRPTLWKYHDWLLKLDGEGGYTFQEMTKEMTDEIKESETNNSPQPKGVNVSVVKGK